MWREGGYVYWVRLRVVLSGCGFRSAHGYRLQEVEIRVPGLILSPKVAPGVRRDLAGTIDVAPTLLALAG